MNFFKKRDVKLFLVLIPVFTLLDYSIAYASIILDGNTLLSMFADIMQGYVVWLVLRFIILRIEKKKILVHSTWKRLLFQFFVTSVAAIAVCMIPYKTVGINGVLYAENTNFFSHDLVIFLLWISVSNCIYILLGYYEVWKRSEERLNDEKTLKADGLNIKIGDKNVKVPIKNILGFFVEDGCTYMIDANFKSFIVDASLNTFEEKLPERYFFRVNRKYILHRNAITSFKRIEDNKLLILTSGNNPLPGEITMSRLKAPAFKKWFEADAVFI